jgi:hypothetical protein
MTRRETPVARETTERPPRPQAKLSAATTSRRDLSSRTLRKAPNLSLIPAKASILQRRYTKAA